MALKLECVLRAVDRGLDYVEPLVLPGLVGFAAIGRGDRTGVFLGMVAGGWAVVNCVAWGHTLYVLPDDGPPLREDRDW